jgi:hypothetical protein
MGDAPRSDPSRLSKITTLASVLADPVKFVLRYGRAVRKYIGALLRDDHDADDVSQDLLLEVLHKKFVRREPGRGRFRDYLKAAARNVALGHLRRRARARTRGRAGLAARPAPAELAGAAEAEWLAEWRSCILEMTWKALELYQYRHPGNYCHTALRLSVDHPREDSRQLAARLGALTGRPMRADAFRKQLSRARRIFARLLLAEVGHTLEHPSPERLEQELIDVGLMSYVQPYLPPDWRSRLAGLA